MTHILTENSIEHDERVLELELELLKLERFAFIENYQSPDYGVYAA